MKKYFFLLVFCIFSYATYIKIYLKKLNENHFLLLFFLIFFLFFFCYFWYFKENKRETEFFNKSQPFRELMVGWIYGSIAVISSIFLYWVAEDVTFISARLNLQLILYALVFSFGAGVMEEILFRGLLQGFLRRFFVKPIYAPLVIFPAACAFAYVHKGSLPDLYQSRILLVLMAGILLGMMAYITDALWLSIGAHFSWNFFQTIFFGYEQKLFGMKFGVASSIESSRTYSIIILGIILVFWFVLISKGFFVNNLKNKNKLFI